MAIHGIGGTDGTAVTDGTTHAENESSYGKWLMAHEAGLPYLYHAELDPDVTDASFVSPGIRGSWINGNKIGVVLNITNAGANVATPFYMDGSYDGKTWTKLNLGGGTGGNFIDDVTPDGTIQHIYVADLSNYKLPWYRLHWNTAGQDATTVKFNFALVGLVDDEAQGLSLQSGITDSSALIAGIGKAPS